MMTIYMVTDGDGYALTDGLQEHEAERVAQQIANSRGESVWLSGYHLKDDENGIPQMVNEGDADEITPS